MFVYLEKLIGIKQRKMVQLTQEHAILIANKLGTLTANECYNELTILLQAIEKSKQNEKIPEATVVST